MRHKKKRLNKEDIYIDDSVLIPEEYFRMTPEELDEAYEAEKKKLAAFSAECIAEYQKKQALRNKMIN